MSLKNPIIKKTIKRAASLAFILFFCIFLGYLTNHMLSENAKFETFVNEIFEKEV